ncbi:type II toxin-antitoxin system CcdA family antitoxin [Sphingomonas psychrotolerans]|uniref:Type II toxin-antitoxin system CcdA family antitoxin n=1 Tax=Sphingomonas psychrotolerans TaxID=1327635 RepID=A0ABU3N041_9SPHN|nr:type II toxin-antitoxin system CcdA family antitoxin [Sphingomonas psychrotolerans]MDT8757920.1 type II toxin-antitoxin system CcdA family antitoxin [Sphingomonas psychrotolerans]
MNAIIPSRRDRQPTELTLDSALIHEASRLGIDLSEACERGLAEAIARHVAPRWQADNADALAASNAHVERHGLPLADARLF